MFLMRFDMRAPGCEGAELAQLYEEAVKMSVWGEGRGCMSVVLSEHHASEDGYLPAPLLLASAIAANTRTMSIQIAALLLPLYDPVRVAEDMTILDILARGRVSYVLGLGYRPEEYDLFGVPMKGRGRRMEQWVDTIRRAWSGESFEFEGRHVQITPRPFSPSGPMLMMGGNTERAAKRAARLGVGFLSEGGKPELEAVYLDACREEGRDPEVVIVPPGGTVTCAFVATDPDQAWRELGPHMLHDARMYADWAVHGPSAVSHTKATTVDELRAERGAYQVFTPQEAADYIGRNGILVMHPLCGGTPIDAAWKSLQLLESEVLPILP
jgi:alkanesulfonate monooxygenase SsuD/methylene tetrahydromethanopterin reductase-like flavin-dependent oxidoreductase (luciferase family)